MGSACPRRDVSGVAELGASARYVDGVLEAVGQLVMSL